MKKKLFVATLMSLIAYSSFAIGPKIDFGVKGGINTTNFDLNKIRFDNAYWLINESRTGFHAGVFMRVNLIGFHIQPEFNYNWNSYKMNILPQTAGDKSVTRVHVQTLEVPVLLGMRLLFLRLNAGPVFNVMTDTSTGSGSKADVRIQKPSVSYAAGLGVDMWDLSLDIRYNGQFVRATQNLVIGDQGPFNFRNNFRGWTLSLGYTF